MISIDATTMKITMHKGDTGSVDFMLAGDPLGENDRVLFTVKDSMGNVVKQDIIAPVDGSFSIEFSNADTCDLKKNIYAYDIRVLGNPTIEEDRIVSAESVDTPANAAQLELIDVVGDVPSPADDDEGT